MSFWSFIDRIGEGIHKIGEKFTGVLDALGVRPLFDGIKGLLGQVQGFGKSFQGLLGMAKELFKNPRDLLNPKKLLAAVETTGLLNSFGNLRKMIEQILGGVGGLGALTPEQHQNVIRAAQASAWNMALQRP